MRRIVIAASLGLIGLAIVSTWRAMRWGATPEEMASTGPGSDWFEGVHGSRLKMTRAISIDASPTVVWPWLAQLGRGAGWYSYDRVDNGGRPSARHIVSWIPEPSIGDAAAIGYLRHLEPGRELSWWAPETPFLGARTWSRWRYRVTQEGEGSRLLMQVDAAAAGATAWFVILLLPAVDSIMALRQLANLKNRAERLGAPMLDPQNPETGERDQYQLYHVIHASGEEAGVVGSENARRSRSAAEAQGLVTARPAAAHV